MEDYLHCKETLSTLLKTHFVLFMNSQKEVGLVASRNQNPLAGGAALGGGHVEECAEHLHN